MRSTFFTLCLFLLSACSQDKPDVAAKPAITKTANPTLSSLDCSNWDFVVQPIVKQAGILKNFPELQCHINQTMSEPAIDCVSAKGFYVSDMKARFLIYSHPMAADYSYVELNEKMDTVRAHLQKLHGMPDIENQIDGLVWISLHTDGRERRTTLKADVSRNITSISCNISPAFDTIDTELPAVSDSPMSPPPNDQTIAPIDIILPPEIADESQKNYGASISGDIQYPMQRIPPMRICAISDENKTHACVETKAGEKTYAIQNLPPANYIVIVEAHGGKLPVAAHVAPVQCIRAPCPDLPKVITIAAGSRLTNIHINGFYDARSDFPKMP
jgi:hypothetical protein